MKSAATALFLALMLATSAPEARADDDLQDPLGTMIWNIFQMRRGKTLCLSEATPLMKVRGEVAHFLRAAGALEASFEEVSKALWTLYPCPFSPNRPELRPATARDIEGAWLFPRDSQKLYSGLSTHWRPPTVQCDALGYFRDGEFRHIVVDGPARCPIQKADDLETARDFARRSRWALLREGRIQVYESEFSRQREEWDVFAVFSPFEVEGVRFQAGDLVAYGRRGAGNEVNAATHFRHLQRLP